eukprot:TRINITY_DN6819_c0_g2_i2.p1 TRINITY_DN6819_c0_g2~~TRINITY_DN6819_c0_g2_i2.p1  ORF type:complete len:415 (+),score=123.52 TRINITY_DN6819_c0_g2_i2:634-1878(+)
MGIIDLAGAAARAVAGVLLVASCGGYIAHKGVFPKPSIKVVDKLVVELFTPCLILGKVTPQVNPDLLVEFWPLMLVCVWNVTWGLIIGYLLSVVLDQRKLRGVLQAAIGFPNTISVVLTLSQALCKTKQVQELSTYPPDEAEDKLFAKASMMVLTSTLWWNFARWTVAYNLLAAGEEETFLSRIKKVFNPPVIACGLSFIIGFIPPFRRWWVGGSAPAVLLTDGVNMVGRCTVPVILVLLGARVYYSAVEQEEKKRKPLVEEVEMGVVTVDDKAEEQEIMIEEEPAEEPEEELSFVAKVSIVACRQVVCLLLGLVLVYFVSFTTDDVMLLLVCFLQTAGPPMINLTVIAGLHGCFESSIAHTLLIGYLSSILSWIVGISLCLRLLHSVLPVGDSSPAITLNTTMPALTPFDIVF